MKALRSDTRHRQSSSTQEREGVTTVEFAIITMVFLTVVFGMVEMSLVIFRYHIVSHAARQGARLAIVRGELTTQQRRWDPQVLGSTHTALLSANDPISNALRPSTGGVIPEQTTVTIAWPDTTNKLGSPVQVEVATTFRPFVTFLFSAEWNLNARSTMLIEH